MQMVFFYLITFCSKEKISMEITVQLIHQILYIILRLQAGWRQSHLKNGFDWFFLKHAKLVEGAKILIFDGHISHILLQVIDETRNNNIHIILLPAHTTHFLQPLDVGVFCKN